MHLDDAIDIILQLFWWIAGTVSMVFCFGIVSANMKPYTLPDKTAITTVNNNEADPYQWTVRDYILTIMVQDEYCPSPKAIDIKIGNSGANTLIEFDSDFLTNMEGRLQRYYIDYLNTRVDNKITSYDYYYEDGGKGRWRFVTN